MSDEFKGRDPGSKNEGTHGAPPSSPPSEPPRDDDRLLSVKDLALKLDVSRPWLYQRVARGEMPFIRVGGLVRFHWPTVWGWLQGGQLPPSGGMLPSKPRGRR
jgi:excisionase family DNA binding protein